MEYFINILKFPITALIRIGPKLHFPQARLSAER